MKLLDNARKGDVVIVWKLDRLARSIRQLLDTAALLSERAIELYSLTENINTTTPTGKLTFHIFASLAEFERDILRQDLKRRAGGGVWVGDQNRLQKRI
jgi:DNA invertase Pin-like site-specific DNA recombinase